MSYSTSFQVVDDAAKPDVSVLRYAPKNMLHLLNSLDSDYVISLRQKSERLVSYTRDSSESIKQGIIELKAKLRNQNLVSRIAQLEELLLAQKDSTADTKSLLENAAQKMRASLKQSVIEMNVFFEEIASQISVEVNRIEDVLIKVHIPEAMEGKQFQKEDIEKKLEEANARKRTLIDQKNALIDSLDIIRRRSLADMFSDSLPTADDIDGLDLAQPEIAAMKQGLHQYQQMLRNVSEGIEYADMADARDHLYRQIEQQNKEIEKLNQGLDTVHKELQDVSILSALDLERDRYVIEARKFLGFLDAFLARLDNLIRLEMYSMISELLDEKLNHLKEIEQEYK
ncbi:alpha-xenorhabdolysin family binary toxin subunit B [Nodosilinea sp. FACHB-131]|uniref:alpha-xenorhabdolysin family binary toxin subunit B n=1 Tax=Cyanophyceae TaxID=3028117 RepID=UPI00168A1BE8|nr:alpha-xenorhabdolysin family binary toxin subunit B [Nodosilinea sp. FACHB-131]MBD1876961.1 alpha-xenorhabdolysin family binary toxin subunit B [Nodosilinea sp. FACHB-131]